MLERFRKLIKLSRQERRLLLESGLLLAAVRLGLWLLPFRSLRRLLDRRTYSPVSPRKEVSAARIAWAVTVASRYVPAATCLAQALAAQALLTRRGQPASLHIGVATSKGQLEAHAWLESQGEVLIGGSQLDRYKLLAASR